MIKAMAHYRKDDSKAQSVAEHLQAVAMAGKLLAGKIGLGSLGELMGLLHDAGKYSRAFQDYIGSAVGQIDPDAEEYVDASGLKGKIDHSTAGAQYIWRILEGNTRPEWQLARQIMSLSMVSHHSGLIDCLSPVGEAVFTKRMGKHNSLTNFDEVFAKIDEAIKDKARECLESDDIGVELKCWLERLSTQTHMIGAFTLGMLTRFLFSTLIDADRLDSANFENPKLEAIRNGNTFIDWKGLIVKLERHLGKFELRNPVDRIRAGVSDHCSNFSVREKGLFTLTVPTGGGKTLASLRFALLHAEKHQMERIIYVVPYTSIIDQNAKVVRNILEDNIGAGQIVLEHHSNLTPENDTWQSNILSENWAALIVYTTAVQFLETLFAAGTRGARRMHQLANTVIVFDEIQTMPIRMIHIFNNAINFLVGQCGSTAVFCTATQPILDKVDTGRGAAILSHNPEMMPDVRGLFKDLCRVVVTDESKNNGWLDDEIACLALHELSGGCSVLIIVNTKAAAQSIYKQCKEKLGAETAATVLHLSTGMCPAHRMIVVDAVRSCLDPDDRKPVICVSTQLIEAGVDIDFGCVIRYMAGLDSIAQAAGRCNRHGLRDKPGKVIIINPANESLDSLADIRIAKEITERVLGEFNRDPAQYDNDLIGPKTMELYYKYYFFDRAGEMVYPVSSNMIGRDGDLLSLLSLNDLSVQSYKRANGKSPSLYLRQSFKSAATAFTVIDAATEGVIVPYGKDGAKIIADLCGAFDVNKHYDLLKQAQRYSVNVFPNIFKKLLDNQCIHEVQEGSGIMYLDCQYYSPEFGLSVEQVAPMAFLNG
jgi:CRISPR-associated endonuclease/helicase Cas3